MSLKVLHSYRNNLEGIRVPMLHLNKRFFCVQPSEVKLDTRSKKFSLAGCTLKQNIQ